MRLARNTGPLHGYWFPPGRTTPRVLAASSGHGHHSSNHRAQSECLIVSLLKSQMCLYITSFFKCPIKMACDDVTSSVIKMRESFDID